MYVRKNWDDQSSQGKAAMNKQQIEAVAAVGSFVVVKGGNLYRD
jgi:hypothetical protein